MDWNFEIEQQLTKELVVYFENIEHVDNTILIEFYRGYPDNIISNGKLIFNEVLNFQKTKDDINDEEDEEKDELFSVLGLGYRIQNGIYEFVLKTFTYEFCIYTNQLPNIQEIP